MREKEGKESQGKKGLRVARFSRRQFFERVGATVGSAVIASIALETACQGPGGGTAVTTADGTTEATTPPASTNFVYVPPTTLPPILEVPGTKCQVANDGRLYSLDHIWVIIVSASQVVLGITNTFVTILYEPYRLVLVETGTTLAHGELLWHNRGLQDDVRPPKPG